MPGIRAGKARRHLRGAPQKRGRRRGGGLQTRLLQGKGTEGSSRPPPPPPPRLSLPPRSVFSLLLCPSLHLSGWPHTSFTPTAGGRRAAVGGGRGAQRDSAGQVGAGRAALPALSVTAPPRGRGAERSGGPGTCGRPRRRELRRGGGRARRRAPSREAALSPACGNGIGSVSGK